MNDSRKNSHDYSPDYNQKLINLEFAQAKS